jgi:hypothetical protein
MEQTPTVKAAYTTPLTTPFAVAETPMCLMMAATTVHSPCGVSPIALGLASPELSTSPAAVPRAPLATLNGPYAGFVAASARRDTGWQTAMQKLRIVTLGWGTGRHKMALERGTKPKHSRRACSPRYGLQYMAERLLVC